MSIQFFIHHAWPDDTNERRALMRVARLLYRQYAQHNESLVFIGNLDPMHNSEWRNIGLSQLDGLLLGQKLAAILEFKNYYEPVKAPSLDEKWFVGQKPMLAGSKKNLNPFQQMKKARTAWIKHLETQRPDIAWQHLNVFLLFHPYLDNQSHLPQLGSAHYWFQIQGIDEIIALTLTSQSSRLFLPSDSLIELATQVFHSRLWTDMNSVLVNRIGTVHIQNPGKDPFSYPLYSYDEWLIGRSATDIQTERYIFIDNSRISRLHARLEVREKAIRLYDLGSTNGSFRDKERIEGAAGVHIHPGEHIFLGGNNPSKACQLWFEPWTHSEHTTEAATRTT